MVGRATDGTREQVSDACLKNRVGHETDRVLVTLGFQELIEVRRGEGRIASEVAPHLPIPISSFAARVVDRLSRQHTGGVRARPGFQPWVDECNPAMLEVRAIAGPHRGVAGGNLEVGLQNRPARGPARDGNCCIGTGSGAIEGQHAPGEVLFDDGLTSAASRSRRRPAGRMAAPARSSASVTAVR